MQLAVVLLVITLQLCATHTLATSASWDNVGLLHMPFNDSGNPLAQLSPSGFTGVANGLTITMNTKGGSMGAQLQSMHSGKSTSVTTSPNPSMPTGVNSFSVSYAFYIESYPTTGGDNKIGIVMVESGQINIYALFLYSPDNTPCTIISGGPIVPVCSGAPCTNLGTWLHVVLAYDYTGNTQYTYVNGVLNHTDSNGGWLTYTGNNKGPFEFGTDGNEQMSDGSVYIRHLRLFNYTLSAYDAVSIYSVDILGVAPPTAAPTTVAPTAAPTSAPTLDPSTLDSAGLLHMPFTDSGNPLAQLCPSGFTANANGLTTLIGAVGGRTGAQIQSMHSGTSTSVTTSPNPSIPAGVNSFTVCYAFYIESYPTTGGTNKIGIVMWNPGQINFYPLFLQSADNTPTTIISNVYVPVCSGAPCTDLGVWVHVVTAYSYSLNTQYTYVNGVLNHTDTNAGWLSITGHAKGPFQFGTDGNEQMSDGSVYIQHLRLFNYTLNANDVAAIYSHDMLGTDRLTSAHWDAWSVFHFPFDDGSNILNQVAPTSAAMNANGLTATHATVNGRVGILVSSMHIGSSTVMTTTPDPSMGSGSFSCSYAFNIQTLPSTGGSFSSILAFMNPGQRNFFPFLLSATDNTIQTLQSGGGFYSICAGGLLCDTTSTWVHVVVTYDQSTTTVRSYINGVFNNSVTDSGWTSYGTHTLGALWFGTDGNEQSSGTIYLQHVRLFNWTLGPTDAADVYTVDMAAVTTSPTSAPTTAVPTATPTSQPTPNTPFDIIMLAGQSNGVGHGLPWNASVFGQSTTNPNLWMMSYNSSNVELAWGNIVGLPDPASGLFLTTGWSETTTDFLLTTGRDYVANVSSSRRLLLVKCAKDGSCIEDWHGNLEQFCQTQMTRAMAAGPSPSDNRLIAFFWQQGECDVSHMTYAQYFQSYLSPLVDGWRNSSSTSHMAGGSPTTPLFMGGMVEDYWAGVDGNVFNYGLSNIATYIRNSYFVSSNGTHGNSGGDGVHFNTDSLILLGHRYAASLLNVVEAPTSVPTVSPTSVPTHVPTSVVSGLDIIMLGGQSNAMGVGLPYNDTADGPGSVRDKLYMMSYNSTSIELAYGNIVGRWSDFAVWFLGQPPWWHYNWTDLLLTAGRDYLSGLSDPTRGVLLVKCAKDGSSITAWPGNYEVYCQTQLTAAMAAGPNPAGNRLVAFFWQQGEADETSMSASTYLSTYLLPLVQNWRNHSSSSYMPNASSTTPLLMGGLCEQYLAGKGDLAFNDGLAQIGSYIPHAYYINASGTVGMVGNVIHLDTASQYLLGHRYAAQLLAISTPSTAAPTSSPSRPPTDAPTSAPTRTNCSLGQYSPTGVGCSACEVGRYAPQWGLTSCLPCMPGTFANNTGHSACSSCAPGSFTSDASSSHCNPCTGGTYASHYASTICVLCTGILLTDGTGANVNCTGCDTGSFYDGDPGCSQCAPGRFADTGDLTACLQCPPGRFSDSVGGTTCATCVAGSYASASGSTHCTSCATGSVRFEAGETYGGHLGVARVPTDCATFTYPGSVMWTYDFDSATDPTRAWSTLNLAATGNVTSVAFARGRRTASALLSRSSPALGPVTLPNANLAVLGEWSLTWWQYLASDPSPGAVGAETGHPDTILTATVPPAILQAMPMVVLSVSHWPAARDALIVTVGFNGTGIGTGPDGGSTGKVALLRHGVTVRDRWAHLALVYSHSAGTLRVAVDGILADASSDDCPCCGSPPPAAGCRGIHPVANQSIIAPTAFVMSNTTYALYVDDVSFFTSALSAEQVLAVYNGTLREAIQSPTPAPTSVPTSGPTSSPAPTAEPTSAASTGAASVLYLVAGGDAQTVELNLSTATGSAPVSVAAADATVLRITLGSVRRDGGDVVVLIQPALNSTLRTTCAIDPNVFDASTIVASFVATTLTGTPWFTVVIDTRAVSYTTPNRALYMCSGRTWVNTLQQCVDAGVPYAFHSIADATSLHTAICHTTLFAVLDLVNDSRVCASGGCECLADWQSTDTNDLFLFVLWGLGYAPHAFLAIFVFATMARFFPRTFSEAVVQSTWCECVTRGRPVNLATTQSMLFAAVMRNILHLLLCVNLLVFNVAVLHLRKGTLDSRAWTGSPSGDSLITLAWFLWGLLANATLLHYLNIGNASFIRIWMRWVVVSTSFLLLLLVMRLQPSWSWHSYTYPVLFFVFFGAVEFWAVEITQGVNWLGQVLCRAMATRFSSGDSEGAAYCMLQIVPYMVILGLIHNDMRGIPCAQ